MEKNKRYNIFISSTFTDLKDVRKNIHDSILKDGHYPIAMENFVASNNSQMDEIKKLIDNCDYYILILGCCYGTIDKSTNKSFTELEYEYAKKINKPILAFFLSDNQCVKEDNKLKKFKKIVKNNDKLCSPSETKELISSTVNIALHKQYQNNPQVGWLRNINKVIEKTIYLNDDKFNTNIEILDDNFMLSGLIDVDTYQVYEEEYSFKHIFKLLARELIEGSIYDKKIKYFLEFYMQGLNTFNIKINDNCFEELRAIFLKIKFIVLEKRKYEDGKSSLFWKITEDGEKYFLR
ncbi:MAG: DUF4062 domain-containing protein [Sulfurimonas sp.]|nr:DUF4062 domain-containing protein [Sulfurimonas sp.]MDD3835183.1 DUF4062 domain-containing protein [Sulfurimonas sp.]